MVLVNGADGIGTGWMTKIPNYNPRGLVNNLRRMLNDEEPEPMVMMNSCLCLVRVLLWMATGGQYAGR
jgi:DNA gyrase/topoisomerase IV subunit A